VKRQKRKARNSRSRAKSTSDSAPTSSRATRSGIGNSRGGAPQPLWKGFPLTELAVLLAFVLCVWGFFTVNSYGRVLLGAGALLGSLAGLELALREHVSGYRSHTTVLSGCVGVVLLVASITALGSTRSSQLLGIVLGLGGFCLSFWRLQRLYKRKSAGRRIN
jgi:hypothetical protein